MTCQEIIDKMREGSSAQYKANVVRLGIPEENSIGVSMGAIRTLAKQMGKSNSLAWELWNTGYHEARLLATLIFDTNTLLPTDIKRLIMDVRSWDLCDHLCNNLVVKMKEYRGFIDEWVRASAPYTKRAAFSLMVSSMIHDKNISSEVLEKYREIIRDFSQDSHDHVKKAVSWALREMGKRDGDCREKALALAQDFRQGNKAQVWIAHDVIRELETLVKVEGRKKWVSFKSKMNK